MEVKIKNSDNTLVDADWTIEDGVMVVSPKEVKFEPNDGDIVFVKANFEYVAIYKKANPLIGRYVSFNILNENLFSNENGALCHKDIVEEIRPATEEEKQKLFDKLAKEGLTWDAERRELVKLKWKPKIFETYYAPACYFTSFKPCKYEQTRTDNDNSRYYKGWCFKTEQECQEFCNRLNEAINSVKL